MYNKYTYIYNTTISAIKLNLIPEYQFCVYLYFGELSIQDMYTQFSIFLRDCTTE